VKGKVYAYALDDWIDLYGYHHERTRRDLHEAHERLQEEHADHPERLLSIRRTDFDFNYDIESMYFFDNVWFGEFGKDRIKIRREIFNRWINFAKTGIPIVTLRDNVESRKYTRWIPYEKEIPWFLYMTTDPTWDVARERSSMLPFNQLLSDRTRRTYSSASGTDVCTWVLEEENDNDNEFVEVLLDEEANTAFNYYVTILATLHPTINYVPEREYKVEMPPTNAPTTIQQFIDASSSTLSRTKIARHSVMIVFGALTSTIMGLLVFE